MCTSMRARVALLCFGEKGGREGESERELRIGRFGRQSFHMSG